MRGYLYLTISILTEVFGTAMLKLSEGFTVPLPTLGVAAAYGLSFYCLSLCLKSVPLSLAYAIWSGIGTALTALLGALVWGELFGPLKIAGVLLIIGGVIMLNSSSSKIAGEPEGQ